MENLMLSGSAVLDGLKLEYRDGKVIAKASLDVGGVRLMLERPMAREDAAVLALHVGDPMELALVMPYDPGTPLPGDGEVDKQELIELRGQLEVAEARVACLERERDIDRKLQTCVAVEAPAGLIAVSAGPPTPKPKPTPEPPLVAETFLCPKCSVPERKQHCGGLCRTCYDKIYYAARKAKADAQKAGPKRPAKALAKVVLDSCGAREAARRCGVDKDLFEAWLKGSEPSENQRALLVEVYAGVVYDEFKRKEGLGEPVFAEEVPPLRAEDLAGAHGASA